VNILVAYGSHLGSTAAIAEDIGDTLRRRTGGQVTVLPAPTVGPIDAYDAVLVGGGIYAGRWHPDAVAFVRRHAAALTTRKVWFFSSGPLGESPATAKPVAPVEMKELAELVGPRDHAIFAGSHDRSEVEGSELSRIEKFIAKRFVPQGDWRDWTAIEVWTNEIARELQPTSIGAL
jgi:menaquinone-dependent protoporphyrinogen oxidase